MKFLIAVLMVILAIVWTTNSSFYEHGDDYDDIYGDEDLESVHERFRRDDEDSCPEPEEDNDNGSNKGQYVRKMCLTFHTVAIYFYLFLS